MTEKTHAQKAFENRISQKQCIANKNFQDYSEHTDYTEFHDTKYFDYGDYVDCHGDYYDFDCASLHEQSQPKPNIFQRIFGRGSR